MAFAEICRRLSARFLKILRRGPATPTPTFDGGHLREAMLYMTDVLRGLGFTNYFRVGDYSTLGNYTNALGEKPYTSSSVFNFFPPDYIIPGTTANAPEFGQENTASAILRLTLGRQDCE